MVTIKTDFDVKFNSKTVMQLMNCSETSPVFDEMLEEFSVLAKESIFKIKPIALMAFGTIPKEIASKEIKEGTKALFCLLSVGNELTICSTQEFDDGDYVSGLMLDTMADDVLFQLDGLIKQDIIAMCRSKKFGISQRLEAPTNICMESQKVVWEMTDAYNLAGIEIKDSFMFNPVKTLGQIYILDEVGKNFNLDHDCSNCTSYNCSFRKSSPKKITVLFDDKSKEILVKENQSLMEAMFANEIYLPAICGGRGSCGKCGIRLIEGNIPICEEDRNFFTEQQLKNGDRLSCKAYPETDCTISLKQNEQNFEVLTDYSNQLRMDLNSAKETKSETIVVDVGTTTIAMQRINSMSGEIFDTYTLVNNQRIYGADVINRIQASNDGQSENLKKIIRLQLSQGLKTIIGKDNKRISQMIIAGNTTMIHLLMGYSCKTMGESPYKAYNLKTIETVFERIPLTILPGISTFVGADITSGILSCSMEMKSKISLLIDLGTNGEMAIGNKDKLLVTSTAAGPAFEGGNISCGTGSVEGAICNLEMENKSISSISTIGQKPPIGICGTGVIEIVSELLKEELIDETGLLVDEYFEKGFLISASKDGNNIYFTQKDIREIQLAKSAVRAGMETLFLRYGVSYSDVATVYLAGGIGYKIDINKAVNIGMFPKELIDKIIPVGNSSLNGCVKYAIDDEQRKRANKISTYAEEISLSTDKEFNKLYSKYMLFEEE